MLQLALGVEILFWGFSSLYIDIFLKNVHAPAVPCLEYKPRALLLRKLKRVIGFFLLLPFCAC